MMDKTNLLTSKDMARFVADGLLRFDELVPEELNQETCKEMAAGIPGSIYVRRKTICLEWMDFAYT